MFLPAPYQLPPILSQYREHGVTEQMWRSGQALRPYFDDVRSIVRKKVLLPCLRNYPVVDEQNLSFVHFPIRDCGITDDDRVLELARALVKNIAEGEIIYLHCWGGHGRTGTLVCIMLHLMYGYSDTQAMEYCQAVHDLRQCPVVVGSPQTQTQRDQVSRVIQKLMTQSRFRSRTMSGDGAMLRGDEGEGIAVPAQQTLQSTLVSPRAAMSSSGNHSVGMATPETDHAAPDGGILPMPQGDFALPPQDDESAPAAEAYELAAEKQTADTEIAGPDDLLFAVPTNTPGESAGGSALPTPANASPETSFVEGDRMSVSMTVDKAGGEEAEEGRSRMRLGTMDDNDPGENSAIQTGNNSVNVDILQQGNEQMNDTEQDDGGIEVRLAEDTSFAQVDNTPIHPPKQVKPSFTFSRKSIATNQ